MSSRTNRGTEQATNKGTEQQASKVTEHPAMKETIRSTAMQVNEKLSEASYQERPNTEQSPDAAS
jgi:hypothetical protein